ncbi:hypothetical protein RSAG8_07731, partial [Rhizoctonia solani AG-8 WAC10335]
MSTRRASMAYVTLSITTFSSIQYCSPSLPPPRPYTPPTSLNPFPHTPPPSPHCHRTAPSSPRLVGAGGADDTHSSGSHKSGDDLVASTTAISTLSANPK